MLQSRGITIAVRIVKHRNSRNPTKCLRVWSNRVEMIQGNRLAIDEHIAIG